MNHSAVKIQASSDVMSELFRTLLTVRCSQKTDYAAPRLDASALVELRKLRHTVANFFSRQAQLIQLLKVKPEFGASPEPVAKPDRSIGSDRSLTLNDTSDSIHWDIDLPRQLSGGKSKLPSTLRRDARHGCRELIRPSDMVGRGSAGEHRGGRREGVRKRQTSSSGLGMIASANR